MSDRPVRAGLLSRYADAMFWLARYIERAENLARILDVTETFSRDAHGAQNWQSVVQINADEAAFAKAGYEMTASGVSRFYLLDGRNSTSVRFSVNGARENARMLRPLISTEMWTQMNVFYNTVRDWQAADITGAELTKACSAVKEACQAHTGITEGTLYRDQGWYFYQLGRLIERADQTTRLVDIKYHLLLPRAQAVNTPVDVSQWNALLRAAAGYHAYRRVVPRGMTPASVAGFLLLDSRFPRSPVLCIYQADAILTELRSRFGLRGGGAALEVLDELRATLGSRSIDEIIQAGLHEFIDAVQGRLIDLCNALAKDFFPA
jgi:uncharacterized alpha-E superfamily protein